MPKRSFRAPKEMRQETVVSQFAHLDKVALLPLSVS